jgi:hypothetical protein
MMTHDIAHEKPGRDTRRSIVMITARACAMAAILAAAALASSLPAADVVFDYGAPRPPLDETDELELQQWSTLFWEWYDTGVEPAGFADFEFSHPDRYPPGFHPFIEPLIVFGELYSGQWSVPSTPEDAFGIWDLVQQAPVIFEQFRHYTMTGELPGGAAGGGSGNPPPIRPPIPPGELPEGVRQFHDLLPGWVHNSNLWKVRPRYDWPDQNDPNGPGFYREDPLHNDGRPGFDCDDWADAMAGWLQHRFCEGGYADTARQKWLHVLWKEGKGGTGHAMNIVYYGGYYWIVDAQTNAVYGPFREGDPWEVRPLLQGPNRYGLPEDVVPGFGDLYNPGERSNGTEPPAWWDSPFFRDEVERQFGHPWEEYKFEPCIDQVPIPPRPQTPAPELPPPQVSPVPAGEAAG